jgi:PBP1b-binding outer membrane lipoprotein LpoB
MYKIILACFLCVFLMGCSQKCMDNTYDCNSAEKGIKNTFEGVGSTLKAIDKLVPINTLNSAWIKNYR